MLLLLDSASINRDSGLAPSLALDQQTNGKGDMMTKEEGAGEGERVFPLPVPFLLPLPSGLFIDQERDSKQVHGHS